MNDAVLVKWINAAVIKDVSGHEFSLDRSGSIEVGPETGMHLFHRISYEGLNPSAPFVSIKDRVHRNL